jgi:hypothetical protein
VRNVSVTDSDIGVVTGSNVDFTLRNAVVDGCQENCLITGHGSANVATCDGGACPSTGTTYGLPPGPEETDRIGG